MLAKLTGLLGTYHQKLESNQLLYSLLKIKSLTSASSLVAPNTAISYSAALATLFEKDLFNIDQVYLKSSQALNSYTHQSVGLLETLPVAYRLVSSSPATSIEKSTLASNSQTSKQESANFYYLPSTLITNINQPPVSVDAAKIDTTLLNSLFNVTPMQYLIVERMEPVSRHFAIIDFGMPICLSDVIIPACGEIASVSVDYWLQKEQKDSRRLLVSTGITQHSVQLCDIQPPPVCRYIKLIFVSHSSNVVKARIPLGYYFGQPQQLDETYLNYLKKLYEENKSHFIQTIGNRINYFYRI